MDAARNDSPAAPAAGEPVAATGSRPASIAELFEAEESALLRFALGIVRHRDIAEELVQESFLRLQRLWTQIENPRGWIYRCLRNLALNHLRDYPPQAELAEERTPDEARLPREKLGRDEAVGTVRMLLAELPEADRNLVQLKFVEELSYEEISRRTGLSLGNVGFRLHRILKLMLKRMNRAGIEGSEG